MKTIIDFTQEYKKRIRKIKSLLNTYLLLEDPYEIEETRKLLNERLDELDKLEDPYEIEEVEKLLDERFDELDKLAAKYRLVETRYEE